MIEVRGVHPVEADEPVHLIDVAISGDFDDVDWGSITQPEAGKSPENWQAVYDERDLGRLPDGRTRAVFFFHYLDVNRPLESAHGPLHLPEPSPVPDELRLIRYEEPC